jgi:hypothetical protein
MAGHETAAQNIEALQHPYAPDPQAEDAQSIRSPPIAGDGPAVQSRSGIDPEGSG